MNLCSHAAWCGLGKSRWLWTWIAALAVVVASMASEVSIARQADLRIVGSDLFGTEFSKALYAAALDADLRIVVALDGSRPGLDELKSGRADVGLLALPDDGVGALAAAGLDSVVVGYHRVVVLAPAGCTATRVTIAQLAAVFGGDALTPVRWRELGATGDWADRPVVALAPEAGRGIAVECFRHVVLHDRPLKRSVVRYEPPLSVARWFDGGHETLAIAAEEPVDGVAVKVLPVAAENAGPAFAPTAENLQAGNYPLRAPVCLAFRRSVAPVSRPLLRFLFGDAATRLLSRAGVAPLPVAERARQAVAVENR
jgi:ABC-type phosphate transport system substrate-binding protein